MTHLEEFREQTNDLDSEISKELEGLTAVIGMMTLCVQESDEVDIPMIVGVSLMICSSLERLAEQQGKARALRTAHIAIALRGENGNSL